MSVPLAIAVNLVADLVLLGGLTWAMTRPRRLEPHAAAAVRSPAPETRHRAAPRPSLRSRLVALTAVG